MLEINEKNLEEAFKYHAPNADTIPKFAAINDGLREAAKIILATCPRTPLRSRALNNIFEARMLANASIATAHFD